MKSWMITCCLAVSIFPAWGDSINFLENPKPGKLVAAFDFNDPTQISPNLVLTKYSKIVSGKDAIDQTPSLLVKTTEVDNKWVTAFEIKPGYMQTQRYYRLTFDYKILEAFPDDGGNRFYVHSPYLDKRGRTVIPLLGNVNQVKKEVFEIVTDDDKNCGFTLQMKGSGSIAIDNFTIEELPNINTQAPIKFNRPGEGGSWKDVASVCTHLNRFSPYEKDEQVIKMLDMLRDLGVGMIRLTFSWNDLFPNAGQEKPDEKFWARMNLVVDEANKRGIKILALVAVTPPWASVNPEASNFSQFPTKNIPAFEKYVRFLGTSFKGRVQYWEMYNEPNWYKGCEEHFSEYLQQLKTGYQTLKDVDPKNVVLNGGLSSTGFLGFKGAYVGALYDLMDPKYSSFYDALAIHGYPRNSNEMLYLVNNILALMKEKGVSKKIWILETGFSVAGDLTEELQASILEDHLSKLAAHPAIERVFIYNELEKNTHAKEFERGLGIIKADYTPRSSYLRLKKLFSGPTPVKNPAYSGE